MFSRGANQVPIEFYKYNLQQAYLFNPFSSFFVLFCFVFVFFTLHISGSVKMTSSSSSSEVLVNFVMVVVLVMGTSSAQLCTDFYAETCPNVHKIVRSVVASAVSKEKRMGASLLRLHFHDCFVQGCDGSILLDDTSSFRGEKTAGPNNGSVRGYNVIDDIKFKVEAACPNIVSCADIVAIAARDSTVILGGPTWGVKLGRRDSRTASFKLANGGALPSPTSSLQTLISTFNNVGLSTKDLVALSGKWRKMEEEEGEEELEGAIKMEGGGGRTTAAGQTTEPLQFLLLLLLLPSSIFLHFPEGSHTIGQARCTVFKARIYGDANIDSSFAMTRQVRCPNTTSPSPADNNLAPLDLQSPTFFDNNYYKNLIMQKGLLHSDQELYNGGSTDSLVKQYIRDPQSFNSDFGAAMVKMGDISPLTGSNGEIRKNCRMVNN
ncbi:hypothetical protein TEA_009018 [Camellia sinensis var. sinensis]|uniref:peroxidase n=1 Tax=Camellia sinensis var. sinensis TaxID=542762 RepID=A0A4S4ESX7_CAMSN|nr:hypothetical protein TEA_009018 [Camellia sinensis var. sinensis]